MEDKKYSYSIQWTQPYNCREFFEEWQEAIDEKMLEYSEMTEAKAVIDRIKNL